MSKFSFKIVICALLTALAVSWGGLNARAFSLLGPFEPWMTLTNGFTPGDDAEIGGPMCLSNGYRWNVPVVTYGFDSSFVNYFGTNGEAAVVSAINLLNSLPPASQMSPTNFSYDATRQNFTAQAQGLQDLKSVTLYLLLEHLGLASPSLNVYCLKSFAISNGVVTGDVLMRNYDPITYLPTPYVNGALMNYQLQYGSPDGVTNAYAAVYSADPFAFIYTAVADDALVLSDTTDPGNLYTGLTRDDVGGLCYLYSTNNVNYETMLSDVSGVGDVTIVNGAWRPGVDKVTFVSQSVDASGNFLPTTNQYTDTFISNGVVQSQIVQRVTVQPDFIFSATNLPLLPGGLYSRTDTSNWINNAVSNGNPGGAGPGVIVPSVKIVFTILGRGLTFLNGALITGDIFEYPQQWGSFDVSTNLPIVYRYQAPTNQTTISMMMFPSDVVNRQQYTWQMSGQAGDIYDFQTSTDLVNWVTAFTVTNDGTANGLLNEYPPGSQQFYRITPQAN